MKEDDFKELLNDINIDPFTDNHLWDVIDFANSSTRRTEIDKHAKKSHIQRTLAKVAAILIFVSAIGATTAIAANYYMDSIKTHPVEMVELTADEFYKHSHDEEGNPYPILEPNLRINYRGGRRVYGFNTVTGYQLGHESNPYLQDMPEDNAGLYPGVDAFANVKLPDLTPTYLIDNYLLDANGYVYQRLNYNDSVSHIISGFFYGEDTYESIYLYVYLDEPSVLDTTIYSKEHEIHPTMTSYTTASGLDCTITDFNIPNMMSNVDFAFETEHFARIQYVLQFNDGFPIEKIYEVLETIPLVGE